MLGSLLLPDLVKYLFTFLDIDDVYQCMQVSKDWYRMCLQDEVWSSMLQRDFGIEFNKNDSNPLGVPIGALATYKAELDRCKTTKVLLPKQINLMWIFF